MTLSDHTARCPTCRHRLAREEQLRNVRRRAGADVADAPVHYTCMPSPLGTLWIAAGPGGLLRVVYATDEARLCHALECAGWGIAAYCPEEMQGIQDQFEQYFAGNRRTFDLPVDMRSFSPFRRSVLHEVVAIPYGETRSYGEVAALAGHPGAARAVGTVMASNDIAVVIPCHRVVRSDGNPGAYAIDSLGACGIAYKEALLNLEQRISRGKSPRSRRRRSESALGRG